MNRHVWVVGFFVTYFPVICMERLITKNVRSITTCDSFQIFVTKYRRMVNVSSCHSSVTHNKSYIHTSLT
jgi:hypothetical protein